MSKVMQLKLVLKCAGNDENHSKVVFKNPTKVQSWLVNCECNYKVLCPHFLEGRLNIHKTKRIHISAVTKLH